MKRHLYTLVFCIFTLFLAISVASQSWADWPDGKPITVVIQYKAGGGTDTNTRKYCKIMEEFLGATVNAVNRPGAIGALAMDFVYSKAKKKGMDVFSIIRPHGMRGYIFLEAKNRQAAEQAAFGVPYARGILPKTIDYSEIEHMLEQVKREISIKKNDIVEIISGPFRREQAKVTRVDKTKEDVVVELLEAAVPIPITVKIDAVKVIRRESSDDEESSE